MTDIVAAVLGCTLCVRGARTFQAQSSVPGAPSGDLSQPSFQGTAVEPSHPMLLTTDPRGEGTRRLGLFAVTQTEGALSG